MSFTESLLSDSTNSLSFENHYNYIASMLLIREHHYCYSLFNHHKTSESRFADLLFTIVIHSVKNSPTDFFSETINPKDNCKPIWDVYVPSLMKVLKIIWAKNFWEQPKVDPSPINEHLKKQQFHENPGLVEKKSSQSKPVVFVRLRCAEINDFPSNLFSQLTVLDTGTEAQIKIYFVFLRKLFRFCLSTYLQNFRARLFCKLSKPSQGTRNSSNRC